jgi:hypothetical protein
MVPCVRFRDKVPTIPVVCGEGGETLRWQRITLSPVNAAARMGGVARMIDDDDD